MVRISPDDPRRRIRAERLRVFEAVAQNLATGPLLLGIIVPGLADWHATETTVLTFANILVAGASAAIFPLIAQRPIADAVRLET